MTIERTLKEGAMDQYTRDRLARLLEITKDCRDDMHEPDEQGISAIVLGNHLDNAMGDYPEIMKRTWAEDGPSPHMEYVVCLQNEINEQVWINLATLIALARMAK